MPVVHGPALAQAQQMLPGALSILGARSAHGSPAIISKDSMA